MLVGADPGWSPSLLGLVMITIWWSSLRLILPEFRRVSKSAKRSSDVCPVIRVSDIAVSQSSALLNFEGVVVGSDIKMLLLLLLTNTYLRLSMIIELKIQSNPLKVCQKAFKSNLNMSSGIYFSLVP